MDFLEHAAITDVIILGVVLEEVRHRNASAYQRLRTIINTPAKRFFVFVNQHHRFALARSMKSHVDSSLCQIGLMQDLCSSLIFSI